MKRISKTVAASPEVVDAMGGFMPKFGVPGDIDISKTYGEILHLLTLAENDNKRREEMDKITQTTNARTKKIEEKEKRIIWLLGKRNKLSTK